MPGLSMSRHIALAVIVLLWAGIYLPGLGRLELKGEEPRRAVPAIAMLETGNWLVPHLNHQPYLSKPPLVNWLIAGSMGITGRRDEFAARLPSVLAMLALALALVWTGSRWLGPDGALTAAVFVLASVAFIEKGRLAEIEATYVALTGIAMAWWLAAWVRRENGWQLWLVPGLFLGLGLLAKGPTHLLLFYALVVPVLVAAREQRELWSWAHLGSAALGSALLLAWLVPFHLATAGLHTGAVWTAQLSSRVVGGSADLRDWLPKLPMALRGGLPWIVFALLWWDKATLDKLGATDERLRVLVRAARWPLVAAFAGLMLLPGMRPRYTLPLFPAIALLLALVALQAPPRWRAIWMGINRGLMVLLVVAAVAGPTIATSVGHRWVVFLPILLVCGFAVAIWNESETEIHRLAGWSALAAAGGMAVYSLDVMPRLFSHEKLRPVGLRVNALVPENAPVYLVDHGFEPALFYVNRPCRFAPSISGIPTEAQYLLLHDVDLAEANRFYPGGFTALPLAVGGKFPFFVLKRGGEKLKSPSLCLTGTAKEAKLSPKLSNVHD